jgi:TRAP-type C4-dicarboxylate transport system permease small subunit
VKKVCDIIEKIQTILGAISLIVFIVLTTYQIIARITGTNAAFTEEISNYAFIWSVFMGAAIMLRRNEHFRFTAFSDKLKGKTYFINELITLILLLSFSSLIAIHGTQLTMKFWNWKLSSISSVSLGWAWLVLPICGFTSIIYSIESIIKFIKNPDSRKTAQALTEEVSN